MLQSKEPHGCTAQGTLSATHLSQHVQVLLWPHSLIKSQILAQKRGAQPWELSGESRRQLNMPSTFNDSWVRWEEQNDGEQQFSFACVFYTFLVHCPHQRAKAAAIKSTLWLDGNDPQRKLYFSTVQKEKNLSYSDSLAVITNLYLKKGSLSPSPQPCSIGVQKCSEISFMVFSADKNWNFSVLLHTVYKTKSPSGSAILYSFLGQLLSQAHQSTSSKDYCLNSLKSVYYLNREVLQKYQTPATLSQGSHFLPPLTTESLWKPSSFSVYLF